MHIENVHIHFAPGQGLSAAELAKVLGFEAEAARTVAPAPMPRIGQPWPGVDGIYAGISRGENGEPDAHLVLLNAVPDRDLNWEDAQNWANALGDGARLPTRFESALLYANLQDRMDTSKWHWTGTQYSSDDAWYQNFGSGFQHDNGKKFEARARAVRRLIL